MYDSIDIIKEKLLTAIEHTEGFTLAWSLQSVKGGNDFFPVAHTCCNLLDLPMYDSIDIIKEKLLTAIEHTEGFTLAWTLQLLSSPICDVLCNHQAC